MSRPEDLNLNKIAEDFIDALRTLGTHVKYLGVGSAGTEMGAVEFLATKVEEAGRAVAEGLESVAAAIRDSTTTTPPGAAT